MSDLNEQQLARLQTNVQEGAIIRSWCQHAGYAIYKRKLEEILADKKNLWLKGSDEDARQERIRAQGLQMAFTVLTQFMTLGDNASKIINNDVSEVTE